MGKSMKKQIFKVKLDGVLAKVIVVLKNGKQ
jgi:hypothetical protein